MAQRILILIIDAPCGPDKVNICWKGVIALCSFLNKPKVEYTNTRLFISQF
jgi:hypothetical protein